MNGCRSGAATKVAQDVEAAYQFLIARKNVDRGTVGVVGASCGTWQAIPLAKDHAEIRTLVFISGSYLGLEPIERDYESLTDRPILAIYSEDDRYGTPDIGASHAFPAPAPAAIG